MAASKIEPRAILLDIEGTTTPISFVQETLFPYARVHGPEFILNHLEDKEIQAALEDLKFTNAHDLEAGAPVIREESPNALEDTIDYYRWLIDQDRKSTPLKKIQGLLWQHGYEIGELRSVVYPDVPPAFARWSDKGVRIAIYSSGSVLAQQLLFRYSCAGDLTRFISAYFDTRVGSKKEASSYAMVADHLKLPAPSILFVSDTRAELDAADSSGMSTVLCSRDSAPQPEQGHPAIGSFADLLS